MRSCSNSSAAEFPALERNGDGENEADAVLSLLNRPVFQVPEKTLQPEVASKVPSALRTIFAVLPCPGSSGMNPLSRAYPASIQTGPAIDVSAGAAVRSGAVAHPATITEKTTAVITERNIRFITTIVPAEPLDFKQIIVYYHVQPGN